MKIRKIVSFALAALLVVAFAVPAFAGTAKIPVTTVVDPRDGKTEVNGVNVESVLGGFKTQSCIFLGSVGSDGALKTEWLVPGFEIAVTYTAEIPADDGNMNKPMSFRLSINEPDEVGYARDLPVYPDVYNGDYKVKDNGNGSYTIVYTYSDLEKAYADSGRNKYGSEDPKYTFAQVLSESSLFTLYLRNGAFNYAITDITVTSPAIAGGTTTPPTTDGTTTTPNPKTGDSTIIFAVAALAVSGAAVFFMRKRVTA